MVANEPMPIMFIYNHNKCQRCQTARDPYIYPEPYHCLIVVNSPLALVCIIFMKLNPSKDGKESILVMTETILKI